MKLSTSLLALAFALSTVHATSAKLALETAVAHASTVIRYEKFILANGLRVLVSQDKTIPFVHVGSWYHVRSRDERPGRTGFAHLFEHLLFNGSERHASDFFGPIEQMGALDSNGSLYLDRINFYETVPLSGLDRTVWLESDRMGHSLGALVQAKLNEQPEVLQNEKQQSEN